MTRQFYSADQWTIRHLSVLLLAFLFGVQRTLALRAGQSGVASVRSGCDLNSWLFDKLEGGLHRGCGRPSLNLSLARGLVLVLSDSKGVNSLACLRSLFPWTVSILRSGVSDTAQGGCTHQIKASSSSSSSSSRWRDKFCDSARATAKRFAMAALTLLLVRWAAGHHCSEYDQPR